MKTRWLLTLMLALVAIGLGLFVYLMPRSEERSSFAISELKATEVKRIRVERAGEPPIELERSGNVWRVKDLLRAVADPAEANRLLSVLNARAPQRMAPVELARFELDKPQLRLRFDGHPLDFGMVSAVAREQYVLADGAVYVIDPKYTVHIPRTAIGFVSRQLIAEDSRIVALEIPGFSLTQRDGTWTLAPESGSSNVEVIKRFVEDWRRATAQRVERAGSDAAFGNVIVRLADGGNVQFDLVRRGKEIVMRDSPAAIDYVFPAAVAERLLSPPRAAAR